MPATIIDGEAIAGQIKAELRREIEELGRRGVVPGLAVVLVGDDPASETYVRNKTKACAELGIFSITERLPRDASERIVLELVARLNLDRKIHGLLVQLPLPEHINEQRVLNAISPEKDVDGIHPMNLGKLMLGEPEFVACTPHGIQEMLLRSGIDPSGKHVVIIGRSNIVGKPLANILMQKRKGANATVTICHTGTKDVSGHTRAADIIVAAAGKPKTVTADMVKDGVVVIDVGMNRVQDPTAKRGYRLVGDVDYEEVRKKAGAISPVPGGVGPMTIAMLLANTVKSAKMKIGMT